MEVTEEEVHRMVPRESTSLEEIVCLGTGGGELEVSSTKGEMVHVLVPAAAAPLTHGEHIGMYYFQ